MKRILIIDDDEKIRTVFKRFLTSQGYDVVCVENGKKGLCFLDGNPLDLVITDILMPNTDGLEVVLSMHEKYPDIPVIAISGGMALSSMDFLPMVKRYGAIKVFYKPVEFNDLLAGVQELLGEK